MPSHHSYYLLFTFPHKARAPVLQSYLDINNESWSSLLAFLCMCYYYFQNVHPTFISLTAIHLLRFVFYVIPFKKSYLSSLPWDVSPLLLYHCILTTDFIPFIPLPDCEACMMFFTVSIAGQYNSEEAENEGIQIQCR